MSQCILQKLFLWVLVALHFILLLSLSVMSVRSQIWNFGWRMFILDICCTSTIFQFCVLYQPCNQSTQSTVYSFYLEKKQPNFINTYFIDFKVFKLKYNPLISPIQFFPPNLFHVPYFLSFKFMASILLIVVTHTFIHPHTHTHIYTRSYTYVYSSPSRVLPT